MSQPLDTTPNPFTFADMTAVALSTTMVSNVVTVSGINGPAPISVSGGAGSGYSVNSGAYTTSAGTVNNGDRVRVHVASSSSALTAVDCTLTIGGVSDTFTVTTASGSQAVLSPNDFTFLGFQRFTSEGGVSTGLSLPGLVAHRIVGGEVRIFSLSSFLTDYFASGYQLNEWRIVSAPGTNVSTAPYMALVRQWGDIFAGHIDTDGGSDFYITGGMWWDEANQCLHWCYGSGYVPLSAIPTHCVTFLNEGTGVATTYGPWRVAENVSRFIGGTIFEIPAAYTSLLPGATFAQVGTVYSGAAQCPQGANLGLITMPSSPTTQAADTFAGSTVGISQLQILKHDIVNPQYRANLDYAYCLWGDVEHGEDPTYGIFLTPGTHAWGLVDGGAGGASLDGMTSAFMVSTASKRGLIYIGTQMRKHFGYAENNWATDKHVSPPYSDNTCPHGHIVPSEQWSSRGPFCEFCRAMMWIYDPNQLSGSVAVGGATALYGFTPVHNEVELADMAPLLDFAGGTAVSDTFTTAAGNIGSGSWDAVNKRYYLPIKCDAGKPAVMVIGVNC